VEDELRYLCGALAAQSVRAACSLTFQAAD